MSGGCVEGAVYELGRAGAARTAGPVLQRYGVSDDDAFAVGLTCGGILDIFVEKVEPRDVRAARRGRRRGAQGVAGRRRHRGRRARRSGSASGWWSGRTGSTAAPARGGSTTRCATTPAACSTSGRNAMLTYGVDGQRRGEGLAVFVESFAPPPRMIVFGAIDFAAACAKIGSFLGYRVTVCDARPVFATASRFPGAQRGRRRVAAPLPRRGGRGRAHRQAHGALRADPRPEVRRAAAGGGAAAAGGRPTSARWGPAGPTTTGWSGCVERGLTEAEIARMSQPDRARPRRAHARGDGRVDRRGDDRAALGRRRARRLAEREGPIHTH